MTKSKNSLFAETIVEGYSVKPWSLGTVEKLAPCIERVTFSLIKKGVTLDNAEKELPKVITSILPEVAEVLGVTLGKPIEEMRELPMALVISISLVIFTQNVAYLKNSFSPLKGLITELTQIT